MVHLSADPKIKLAIRNTVKLMKSLSRGKVILIGAGPGDAELITLKAVRYLQQADVVLTDRLVNQEILDTHVPSYAKIIFVGKEGCNQGESVSQKEINNLLVRYAVAGNTVVRLKGGDVAFFSNVLDELAILQSSGISYEIVPGITAAAGASAYAGIPLTARGYARGVRFLTYSSRTVYTAEYWKELAGTEDTLVFYMAGETWFDLATHFMENNVSTEKELAIIQQATTPVQQVFIHKFNELCKGGKPQQSYVSPSIVIIGKVVGLHETYSWWDTLAGTEPFFRSASRKAVEVINENKLSA